MSSAQPAAERTNSLTTCSSSSEPQGYTAEQETQQNELSKTTTETANLPTSKVIVIMACLVTVLFLVALDRLIIGVAIPKITDEFHSLGDVGWYASSYLLTSCAFMLLLGRVYAFYNPKTVYLCSLVVFEIGSAVCGAAQNSNMLIVGRALAGLGNAGLFQGAVIIIVYIIPLHKRPQYMGLLGMVFGIASAVGPLLGGAFTDGPGWRWCFYINLPFGGVVLLALVYFLHIPEDMVNKERTTLKEKIVRLDPIGTFFFLPSIICLLLALQWGGVTYDWSDGRIIALLVLFGVLLIAFILVQAWKKNNATVPPRIFLNRSILAGSWFSFCNGGSMQTVFYFLPLWFQAIKGVTAVKSGIMNLPMVLGVVIASIMAGLLTRKLGYYAPWMLLSSILTPIGAGLISAFTPHTGHTKWIGYQALFGLGLGAGSQQPSVAAQTVLARKDVSTGAALMMFFQILGGAVFTSVGNNLFDSRLQRDLADMPGIDVGSVASAGATALRSMVPATLLPEVLLGYNDALRNVFHLATALSALCVFGALAIEWKSVKKGQQKGGNATKDLEKHEEVAK